MVEEKISGFLERRSLILVIAFILIASARIVSTYTVFSHTSDEIAHVACGMEWLDKGRYQWEAEHPPLARVAAALGPYLSGIRSQGTVHHESLDMFKEGANILYFGHHYDRTLALARLGILPFFWIACLAVYWWGVRYFSRAVATAAVFLFTTIPTVLAHGGLATTDMALTAFLIATMIAAMAWAEEPTLVRALCFGGLTGLMVLSKFSSLVFFPSAITLTLLGYWLRERPAMPELVRWLRERLPTFALACVVGFLVIWAGYRFSFGKIPYGGLALPFPELFAGIKQVQEHDQQGRISYLLGETSRTGFWNFFLVGLAYKSPLGFLGLLLIGLARVFSKARVARNLWVPLVFSIGILGVSMFTSINIGLRHVLPVFGAFSLIAAVAVMRLLEAGQARRWVWGLLGGLLLWMNVSSAVNHPDYLAYFNELAGSEPENILVDSDLDWGQDLKRLSKRLHELGVTKLAWTGYVWAELEREHGFPRLTGMDPHRPPEGWSAMGLTLLKAYRPIDWADTYKPEERVGRSILLWYTPPANKSAAPAR